MSIILASSSPRRRELLTQILSPHQLSFSIIKPDIDETQNPGESPLMYASRLSQEKAQAVAQQMTEGTILAADTVVILAADTIGIEENGEILGKPADADDARHILKRLRNRPHMVCTAFTLLSLAFKQQHTEIVGTQVLMRDYTDAEIDAYIATGDPFDKAGSYAIQHPDFNPVARIDGSYSNVVGLPVEAVRAAMTDFGIL